MGARDSIFNSLVAFLVLNSTAIGLRIWVRTAITNSFGYDDIAMCIAYYSPHLSLLHWLDGYGATDTNPDYDPTLEGKNFVVGSLVYMITLYAAKISAALVLYRLCSSSTSRGITRVLQGSVVILTIWSIASTLLLALQCRPLSVAWGVGTGTCLSGATISNNALSISAMDIASSWFYAIVPIWMLWGIQLSTRTKLSIIFLLGLGVVSGVATLVRLKYIIDISNIENTATPEAAEKLLATLVYSVLDVALTIFTGSLAALRPLLRYMPFTGGSSSAQTGQSNTGNKYGSRNMGPPIRLQDVTHPSDAGSQQSILMPSGKETGILKEQQYNITYERA
ncbi:hypothetical protein MGN70_005019 [Eutypa lata]|nr:hypothetical protein MGN70_005019 [Eutypa lata]